MNTDRRQFLKTLTLGATAGIVGLPACTVGRGEQTKLTILHTNDVHSHIDPFPDNHTKYAGKGGFARRFALVKQVRRQEEHVLLLDSGDIFQGTPYFNFYKGELDIKLMGEMGYDASTIGNHEFDNGVAELARQIKKSAFPFINSNYNFENSDLKGVVSPYKIFERGSVKIGVVGLGIQLKGLVTPMGYKGISCLDPVVEGDKAARFLKEKEKCNLVIALSHLGYSYKNNMVDDITVAQETKYIDVILGGHTHTFLDKPTVVDNADNKAVVINQTGWGGINLGRLDFVFDTQKSNGYLANHCQL